MPRDPVDVMNLLSKKKAQDITKQLEYVDEIKLEDIEPPVWQPRKKFEEERLKELTNSIKQHGLLQPLVVEIDGDKYRLVSGERRYRALKIIGVENVPVRITSDLTKEDRIHIQIAENLQREDITPMERSRAVYMLFQMKVNPLLDECLLILTNMDRAPERVDKKIADTVSAILSGLGKSIRTVRRWLSLLKLPGELQEKLDDPNGVFTPKHAGEILKLKDIQSQLEIVSLIESEKLSAQETKEIVKHRKNDEKSSGPTSPKLFVKTTSKWLLQAKALNLQKVNKDSKEKLLSEINEMESLLAKLKYSLLDKGADD